MLPLDLGHSRLLGNSYLQSRELPLTPCWVLTLYDPVKEPSWPHRYRGPGIRGGGAGPSGVQASSFRALWAGACSSETYSRPGAQGDPLVPSCTSRLLQDRHPTQGQPAGAQNTASRTRLPPTCDSVSQREKGALRGRREAAGECTPSEHFHKSRPPQL